MSTLKDILRELLNEEAAKSPDQAGEEGVNRILDADRSPANSDSPPWQTVTEYGINNKIRAHANRQKFGALSRIKARLR